MRLFSRSSPHTTALVVFLICYFIAFQRVRRLSSSDPGSIFFDPEQAFERKYSLEREAHAHYWVQSLTDGYLKAFPDPSFCVGIPTVRREQEGYFRRAVGSTLSALTAEERKDIYLVSFFTDVDPNVHEAYNEEWTHVVSDEVLTYTNAPQSVIQQLHELAELDLPYEVKPLFDYVNLLTKCHNVDTPYVVILEDDVIAAEGWFARAMTALGLLEDIEEIDETIYLRLFYNEMILGWNSRNGPTYLIRALFVELLVLTLLWAALRYVPSSSKILTNTAVIIISLLVTPMCIGLYFAAGRLTMSPLPIGLNRMDSAGCCSQAVIYPREQIPGLIDYFREQVVGKVDELTEEYASQEGLSRWALTPSVFQQVGETSSTSSWMNRRNVTDTHDIWNFSFESLDSEEMEGEHL